MSCDEPSEDLKMTLATQRTAGVYLVIILSTNR